VVMTPWWTSIQRAQPGERMVAIVTPLTRV
jgi:hypothetical protein